MRPSTDPRRVEDALPDLLRMVADGCEFPDAASRVATRHNIDYDLLRAAYDEHCTHPQEN